MNWAQWVKPTMGHGRVRFQRVLHGPGLRASNSTLKFRLVPLLPKSRLRTEIAARRTGLGLYLEYKKTSGIDGPDESCVAWAGDLHVRKGVPKAL